jgi:hypothetical protein
VAYTGNSAGDSFELDIDIYNKNELNNILRGVYNSNNNNSNANANNLTTDGCLATPSGEFCYNSNYTGNFNGYNYTYYLGKSNNKNYSYGCSKPVKVLPDFRKNNKKRLETFLGAGPAMGHQKSPLGNESASLGGSGNLSVGGPRDSALSGISKDKNVGEEGNKENIRENTNVFMAVLKKKCTSKSPNNVFAQTWGEGPQTCLTTKAAIPANRLFEGEKDKGNQILNKLANKRI